MKPPVAKATTAPARKSAEFARRRGKTTADALDDALADYLDWELQDYQKRFRRSDL